jgi:hypothetical protein
MIKSYLAAAYPAVAVQTADEDRTIQQIIADGNNHKVWCIAATGGLRDARTGMAILEAGMGYPQALAKLATSDDTILVVLDYRHIISNAGAYRGLRLVFPALKARGSMVVLVGPSWNLPPEIEHDCPVIHAPLPTREELAGALLTVVQDANLSAPTAEATQAILDAASGLTLGQAESAMSLSYAESGNVLSDRVLVEKLKLIKQSGKLELAMPVLSTDLGGLGALRAYINDELIPSLRDPVLAVRGILMVGVPGTGKSLASRVLGSLVNWPVLRCDIASLKGSLVGQSEANMRAALQLAEAVSPCVLFLDEIEKAVGGYASSAQSDSGVTLGMVGLLLGWLQEHKAQVITVATCNDYAKLPAELTRAGRFDERFFVDLPSPVEREQIAEIHLEKLIGETSYAAIVATLSDGWTGAEIEQLCKSAARRGLRRLSDDLVRNCAADIKPLSRVRAAEIASLREWGRGQLRIANTPEIEIKIGRKLRQERSN